MEWTQAESKSPLNTPAGISGEVGGHKLKSLGKLSNSWTDWHQIWFTSADSSGNGHRLNTIRPTIPQRHLGGGVRGSQIQMFGEDWHQIWYKSADSSGNRLRLNTIRSSIPQGGLGGHTFKSLGKLQTAGPIGTTFGTRLRIRLRMDIG